MAMFYCTATVDNIYYLLFRGLLLAAKRLGHEDTFYWIASDGWGKQQQVGPAPALLRRAVGGRPGGGGAAARGGRGRHCGARVQTDP